MFYVNSDPHVRVYLDFTGTTIIPLSKLQKLKRARSENVYLCCDMGSAKSEYAGLLKASNALVLYLSEITT